MLSHTDIQLACRARLLSLSVVTTGTMALAATSAGYTRATGSFLTDKFARGMEITPAGFGTNGKAVVTNVSASLLSVTRFVVTQNADGSQTLTHPVLTAEASASGRSLTVGLPSLQAWENTSLTPYIGIPYAEEQYIPGPEFVTHDGASGQLEMRPMYSPRIFAPQLVGISAAGRYADAIRDHFTPGTLIALGGGVSLVCEPPFRGQSVASDPPGWSVIPITIPFSVRTVAVPAA